jgi:hypothetical protein
MAWMRPHLASRALVLLDHAAAKLPAHPEPAGGFNNTRTNSLRLSLSFLLDRALPAGHRKDCSSSASKRRAPTIGRGNRIFSRPSG